MNLDYMNPEQKEQYQVRAMDAIKYFMAHCSEWNRLYDYLNAEECTEERPDDIRDLLEEYSIDPDSHRSNASFEVLECVTDYPLWVGVRCENFVSIDSMDDFSPDEYIIRMNIGSGTVMVTGQLNVHKSAQNARIQYAEGIDGVYSLFNDQWNEHGAGFGTEEDLMFFASTVIGNRIIQ